MCVYGWFGLMLYFGSINNTSHLSPQVVYGLRQALEWWLTTFSSHLWQLGFTFNIVDLYLLIYKCKNITMYVLIHVNEMLSTFKNSIATFALSFTCVILLLFDILFITSINLYFCMNNLIQQFSKYSTFDER